MRARHKLESFLRLSVFFVFSPLVFAFFLLQAEKSTAGLEQTPSGFIIARAAEVYCHAWLKDTHPLQSLEQLVEKLKTTQLPSSSSPLLVSKEILLQLERALSVLKSFTANYSLSKSQPFLKKRPASKEIQKLLQAHDEGLIDRVTMELLAYFLLPFIAPEQQLEVADFFMEQSTTQSRDLLEVALHAMLHVDFSDLPGRRFAEHLLFEMAAKHGFTDTILLYFDSDNILGRMAKLALANEVLQYPTYTANSRGLRRALRYGYMEEGRLINAISAVMRIQNQDAFSESLSEQPDTEGEYSAISLETYNPFVEEDLLQVLLSKLVDPRQVSEFYEFRGLVAPAGIVLSSEGDAQPQRLLTRALQILIKRLEGISNSRRNPPSSSVIVVNSLAEDSFDRVLDERDEIAFSITLILQWLKARPQFLNELLSDYFEIRDHLPISVKHFLRTRHQQLLGPLTEISRLDEDPVKKFRTYPLSIPTRVGTLIQTNLN